MRPELRAALRDAGASDDDIDRAAAEGWLPLLALDRVLIPGAPTYDTVSLSRVSGIDTDLLQRLWRALGFPNVSPDALVFTDEDAAAARRLFGRADADELEQTELIQLVQVVSGAMARIASVEAGSIAGVIQRLVASGLSREQIADVLIQPDRWEDLRLLIDYEHRVQLRAALWRRLVLDATPDAIVGVAFADLAGYTKATAHLDPDDITALVARWEDVAYDTVTAHGARIVKTIGDEVMFVGLVPGVVDAVLSLRDAADADPELMPVRAGVAAGPVVARNGDYYGPVVNLASRLTEIARPGEVLAPAALRRQVGDQQVVWVPHGTRRLRSIGDVETFVLERPG
jgi:adenylate cyclase